MGSSYAARASRISLQTAHPNVCKSTTRARVGSMLTSIIAALHFGQAGRSIAANGTTDETGDMRAPSNWREHNTLCHRWMPMWGGDGSRMRRHALECQLIRVPALHWNSQAGGRFRQVVLAFSPSSTRRRIASGRRLGPKTRSIAICASCGQSIILIEKMPNRWPVSLLAEQRLLRRETVRF
jgi:hypothetical protein